MVLNDPARVRFTNFGASSLDIDIFCYIKTSEFNDYWAVVEDLNLKLMAIVEECGTDFAFPSTQVYLEQGSGLDAESQLRAVNKAKELLAKDEIPQPHYPSSWQVERTDRLTFGPSTAPISTEENS